MNIIEKFITKNDCYQANLKRADSRYITFQDKGPQGLILHSVGCAQPSAQVFVRLWDVPNKSVAVHAVLQADGTVLIPKVLQPYMGGTEKLVPVKK